LSFKGDKTLFQNTYERISSSLPKDHIFIITLPDYVDEVREYAKDLPSGQIIVEPARRDTLLAAGLGAIIIRKKDPEAIIANLWSDQMIEGVEAYRDALFAGAKVAWDKNTLVTTGVRPEYAHPGLEYVRKGQHYESMGGIGVYHVDKFIERPERTGTDPESIFKDKKSLWHIGLWIWKAETFLEKVHKHAPETFESLMKIEKSFNESDWKSKVSKVYSESPKVQIDMIISKDQSELYVVEGEFEWLDLGDFNVLWKMSKKDEKFNASLLKDGAEWINMETEGTFVLSSGKRAVVTVGVKGLIVVALDDAILVIPRSEAQKVKQIVEKLKKEKRTELL
jgi:mannose-1-phosphate guanylyltransferase